MLAGRAAVVDSGMMTTEVEPTKAEAPETATPPEIGEGDRVELLDH